MKMSKEADYGNWVPASMMKMFSRFSIVSRRHLLQNKIDIEYIYYRVITDIKFVSKD